MFLGKTLWGSHFWWHHNTPKWHVAKLYWNEFLLNGYYDRSLTKELPNQPDSSLKKRSLLLELLVVLTG